MRILVLGAGVIGMATAYALHEVGDEVTVLDRRAGPGLETSLANGALLHPSLAEPWNSPGILKALVQNLGREDAAVLLRLRALPGLIGWGRRFIRESRSERFEANALKNLRLAQFSLAQLAQLRGRTGLHYHEYRRGILTLHRSGSAHAEALAWYARLASHGLEVEALSPAAIVAKEPALADIADKLVGGVFAPLDEGGDPGEFCTALHRHLADAGVTFRFNETVSRLIVRAGGLEAVQLASAERLATDCCVLAAGSYSRPLAATAGLDLPIRPAKGYSLTLPRGASGGAPWVPVTDSSLHMAVIPVGEDRIRVAGTAEFTGFDTRINRKRVANLAGLLQQLYPRFAAETASIDPNAWTGLRPMCADGVPLIGASGIKGLYLNTGHGHVGWTLAAGSGRLLADVLHERPSPLAAMDYSPSRFS